MFSRNNVYSFGAFGLMGIHQTIGNVDVYSVVPQGSVIGRWLFVIYINDIQDGIFSKINIFAEDTKMVNKAANRFHTEVLQSDLMKLEEWSIRNSMKKYI